MGECPGPVRDASALYPPTLTARTAVIASLISILGRSLSPPSITGGN
jgi:hypothetical protein